MVFLTIASLDNYKKLSHHTDPQGSLAKTKTREFFFYKRGEKLKLQNLKNRKTKYRSYLEQLVSIAK